MVNYVCVLDLGGKSETPFHCDQTPFGCGLRISENLIRMCCLPHRIVIFSTVGWGKVLTYTKTTTEWGLTTMEWGFKFTPQVQHTHIIDHIWLFTIYVIIC